MKKGIIILMWCYIIMMCHVLSVHAAEIDISASSAIVMDSVTGRVLYEKNLYEKRPMASITKIMTAILALENGNLEDIVIASERAARVEGSSIWLEKGEKQKLEDLLYGLMLSSGNDAAIAIAEHISGTVEAFAEKMTEKAREIGAINTNFKNPNGLDADGHYTTAYDVALITRYALNNRKFAEVVKINEKSIPWQGHKWDRLLKNHNKLLNMYEGCDGVKTGYTQKSGRCLVSSATRNGWQIIAVTLNAPNDWDDHRKMLNYAFDQYKWTPVVEKGEFMKTLPIKEGKEERVQLMALDTFAIPMKEGEQDKISFEYEVPFDIIAPVKYNQEIGKVRIYMDNIEHGSVILVSKKYVSKKDYLDALTRVVKNWLLIFSVNNIS